MFFEQRKLGVRASIKGLNYSNPRTLQNVSQENIPENKKTFEILYSISLIFDSQNILLGCCFISPFHFSSGHARANAVSSGELPAFPLGLAGH
ncbi:MAG: hypothetical protein OEU56_21840 [Rhodospirillales bacterium]|nr:hypothetical protein [Rhodospirillales bacterium]